LISGEPDPLRDLMIISGENGDGGGRVGSEEKRQGGS